MSKHTPGPWTVKGRQSIRGPNGEYIGKTNWSNGEANARLIAAAPDLLVALRKMTGWQLTDDAIAKLGFDPATYKATFDQARTAIAKAEGEAP